MKKIINKPIDFVEESIDGLIKSHPDIYILAGMSITTLKLNDNLKKYLFADSECPFWNN